MRVRSTHSVVRLTAMKKPHQHSPITTYHVFFWWRLRHCVNEKKIWAHAFLRARCWAT